MPCTRIGIRNIFSVIEGHKEIFVKNTQKKTTHVDKISREVASKITSSLVVSKRTKIISNVKRKEKSFLFSFTVHCPIPVEPCKISCFVSFSTSSFQVLHLSSVSFFVHPSLNGCAWSLESFLFLRLVLHPPVSQPPCVVPSLLRRWPLSGTTVMTLFS